MKNIKILSLAAAILIATALPLHSDPPTFSQRNLCCWIASWVQFVYNLKPLADDFLGTPEQLFTNLEDFKKIEVVQKDTMKKVPRFIGSDFEDAKKYNFSPNAIEITQAYYSLFKAIRDKNTNLDQLLTQLQKAIQGEQFGKCVDVKKLLESQTNSLIKHPLLAQYSTIEEGGVFIDRIAKLKGSTNIFTKFIIYGSSKVPEFTVDLTPVVTDEIKKEHACLIYDLIGIILYTTSPDHYFVFIKDQYDPEQPWWRCDTISGNKRVSEKEIKQECMQNEGTKHAAYCARDCKEGAKTTGGKLAQDDADLITLTRILKDLSATA